MTRWERDPGSQCFVRAADALSGPGTSPRSRWFVSAGVSPRLEPDVVSALSAHGNATAWRFPRRMPLRGPPRVRDGSCLSLSSQRFVRAAEACSGQRSTSPRSRWFAPTACVPRRAGGGRLSGRDGAQTRATGEAAGRPLRVCDGWRSIGHSPTALVQKQRRRPPPRTTTPGRPRHGRNRYRRRVVFPGPGPPTRQPRWGGLCRP